MKWFWLWRLRVAQQRLRKASDALPPNFNKEIYYWIPEFTEFSIAYCRFSDLLKKCESYRVR